MDETTNTAVEQEQTSDSFMEGWDEPETGELGGTDGETTPAQEPESQISEAQQENAENPAGNQGTEGNQPQPETTGGEGGNQGAQQQAARQQPPQEGAPGPPARLCSVSAHSFFIRSR